MLRNCLTLTCLLLAASLCGAVPAAQLPDFSASYELRLGSLRIGTSSIRLENRADGSYLYESSSTPTPLVSWLLKDKLHETSIGTLTDNGVRPDEYHYSRSGGRKERQAELRFDWKSMTVSNQVEDNRWTMDIPAGTLDKLATQLAMMLALRAGETDISFNIADDGKLKDYRFRVVGEETLELPAGTFKTVKIIKVRENRNRETFIWCAPALNYLPVRIWQREKDDAEYESELAEFSKSLRVETEAGQPAAAAQESRQTTD
jgi:Protein of unknown function (DUF3108)